MSRFKEYDFFRFNELNLQDRLSIIFLATGGFLSGMGFILGLIFGTPFMLNLPHLIVVILCSTIPFILKTNISKATSIMLLIIGFIYFPYIYFTNGGHEGAAVLYFIMMSVYYSFYHTKRNLIALVTGLLVYYITIIIFTYSNPHMMIPYPDEISGLIDLIIGIVAVSGVMTAIAYTSFNAYNREHDRTIELLNELEIRNAELEYLSIRDPLTGIYTRRYFMKKLSEAIEEKNVKYFVMMVDVDHFKNINDTYGHIYGDSVLKGIAKKLDESTRSSDACARYGGEEFVLLIACEDENSSLAFAERMRNAIEDIKWRHGKPVTVSIGLTEVGPMDTAESVLMRSDENLYCAKATGRNKVIYWSDGSELANLKDA